MYIYLFYVRKVSPCVIREYLYYISIRPVPIIEEEKTLLKKYCLPEAEKFRLGEHLMHPPSKETYRIWMHEMLYIEEWAQLEHISRFVQNIYLYVR